MLPPASTSPLKARHALRHVEETLADTPITVVQGARQVGKSTLVQQVQGERDVRVLSLDAAALFNAAKADPDAFVRQSDGLLVIDEVQRVPELIRVMKDAVEEDRRVGQFLITGSANLLELPGTQESLAGRAETVALYGLSQGEIAEKQEDFVDLRLAGDTASLARRDGTLSRDDYLEILCAGSYPEPLTRQGRRRSAWFDNHITRVMSTDARDVSKLAHLDRLPTLLRLLAANNYGELVKARLASDAQIPETSVTSYVELLETLYLIHLLPAWGNSLTKRRSSDGPKCRCSTPDSPPGSTTSHRARCSRVQPAMQREGCSRLSYPEKCAASWSGQTPARACSTFGIAMASKSTSCRRRRATSPD